MTNAQTGPDGPGFAVLGRLSTDAGASLRAVLQLGHDQGINGGRMEGHLAHSAGFVAVIESLPQRPATLVDLGSGGGYPGLVLAVCLPDTEVRLIDRRAKRTDFLRRAVHRLGLQDRVTVMTDDVDAVASRLGQWADVVTARSFGSPTATVAAAAPLLEPDGRLVVSEPPTEGRTDNRWLPEVLGQFGLEPPERRHVPGAGTYAVITRRNGADTRGAGSSVAGCGGVSRETDRRKSGSSPDPSTEPSSGDAR